MGETIEAPEHIWKRDPVTGNTYLAYPKGTPVPIAEAEELGLVQGKAKREAAVEDKAKRARGKGAASGEEVS
jgi:hypothetical protein